MATSGKKVSFLEKRFIEVLGDFPEDEGAKINEIQSKLEGVDLDALAKVVNALLRKGFIELVQVGTTTRYKLIKDAEKEKYVDFGH
jgi:predicted DNA-binding transcriptional regulator